MFLKDLLTEGIGFIVIGSVIYILTKLLKFDNILCNYDNARKKALIALISVCTSILIITILLFISYSVTISKNEISNSIRYNFNSVLSNGIIYIIIMSPILIVMRKCREKWDSIGVSKINLLKSVFVGTITGIISIILALIYMNIGIIKVFSQLNIAHFWGLLYFCVVGFSEEFMFRGYLQTRLIAWLGRYKGWILTSIFMALVHLPQRMFVGGMNFTSAFMSTVSLISISMLMGFMMIRTENVFAAAIYHTLADWGGTLI